MTEEEAKRGKLREPGTYPFNVATAEDTQSRAGNDMIKVKLEVFDKDGGSFFIYDYLLEAMAFKLRHFAKGTGLLAEYEAGELNAGMMVGKSGGVTLEIEDAQGDYPAKNVVRDYQVPVEPQGVKPGHEVVKAAKPAPAKAPSENDPPF